MWSRGEYATKPWPVAKRVHQRDRGKNTGRATLHYAMLRNTTLLGIRKTLEGFFLGMSEIKLLLIYTILNFFQYELLEF